MILRIAGINHFNPRGRKKLEEWFDQLSSKAKTPPLFVAVEWNKNLFEYVKEQQRSMFRGLITNKWPDMSPDLTNELELSLAYEADAHRKAFPSAEVLWLDVERVDDEGAQMAVSSYALCRLAMYESFLQGEPMPGDASRALDLLSKGAIDAASGNQKEMLNDARDIQWADSLISRVKKDDSAWAIAIVGLSHANSKIKDSMINQIKARAIPGLECIATLL